MKLIYNYTQLSLVTWPHKIFFDWFDCVLLFLVVINNNRYTQICRQFYMPQSWHQWSYNEILSFITYIYIPSFFIAFLGTRLEKHWFLVRQMRQTKDLIMNVWKKSPNCPLQFDGTTQKTLKELFRAISVSLYWLGSILSENGTSYSCSGTVYREVFKELICSVVTVLSNLLIIFNYI